MGDAIASSGSLRTKISLRRDGFSQSALVVQPFFLMKPDLPPSSALLGSHNLLSCYDMESALARFTGPRRPKDDLASFLPHLVGTFHTSTRALDGIDSSLKSLVERPPIMGKEIASLSSSAMAGFRLAPGPVDDDYRAFFLPPNSTETNAQEETGEKRKHRKRHKRSLDELEEGDMERRKKPRRGDDEKEKRKKKKKEKKKRRGSPSTSTMLS